MMSDRGGAVLDWTGHRVDDSGEALCEDCGRSQVSRFGEQQLVPYICDSCADDFDRLNRAGKIVIEEVPDI